MPITNVEWININDEMPPNDSTLIIIKQHSNYSGVSISTGVETHEWLSIFQPDMCGWCLYTEGRWKGIHDEMELCFKNYINHPTLTRIKQNFSRGVILAEQYAKAKMSLEKESVKILYLSVVKGVYYHNTLGIFSNVELAKKCATTFLKGERDHYHKVEIIKFNLDAMPNFSNYSKVSKAHEELQLDIAFIVYWEDGAIKTSESSK